jgi:hypothetical protein
MGLALPSNGTKLPTQHKFYSEREMDGPALGSVDLLSSSKQNSLGIILKK